MEARFVTCVLGRIFAVRWVVFTLPALAEVRAQIADRRQRLGKRLDYLSLIPESPRTFTAQERELLGSYVRDLLVHDCAGIHHVIEGKGFVASARRSIVTSLALASATPECFHTYATLGEALRSLAADLGESPETLAAEARLGHLPFP
jgi:hypothetical protein